MFYQGMRQPAMVYPQQLVPRRWNPQAGGAPQLMGVRGQPMSNYQLLPASLNGGRGGGPIGRGGAAGGGRRARGGGQVQGKGRGGMPNGGGPQQNFKYELGVRNQSQRGIPPDQMGGQVAPPMDASNVPMLSSTEPLIIKVLAAAPEEQKKRVIGERLFQLIQGKQPVLAGKITGMLLEMDNGELIHLLETPKALTDKINEALVVLHQNANDDHEGEE